MTAARPAQVRNDLVRILGATSVSLRAADVAWPAMSGQASRPDPSRTSRRCNLNFACRTVRAGWPREGANSWKPRGRRLQDFGCPVPKWARRARADLHRVRWRKQRAVEDTVQVDVFRHEHTGERGNDLVGAAHALRVLRGRCRPVDLDATVAHQAAARRTQTIGGIEGLPNETVS